MTIRFENTNEQYGDNGPFEAKSKEELADEMMSTFDSWSCEAWYAEADRREEFENVSDLLSEAEWKIEYLKEIRAEFIDGLMAQYHGEPRVIFDNGGGITLQLPGYAHMYQDAEQCADDIRAWIEDEDASDWDGNEDEAVFEPTIEELANGGYQFETLADFMAGNEDVHGINASELREALGLTMPETLEGLLVAMQNNHQCVMDDDQWSSNLPTFGGKEPEDADGVWSWDATHKIIGTCADDLEIVRRSENILHGTDAIDYKKNNPDAELNKYNDPTEAELFDISIEDAEDIAREDPALVWLDTEAYVMQYNRMVESKAFSDIESGFDIDESELNIHLKPFQRAIVKWSLKRGRAAMFEGTGLGKTDPNAAPLRLWLGDAK